MFALKPLAPLRLWVLSTAAWSLVACGSFLIFGGLFDDGHDEGRSELACAKAKLEELWDMPLPADLEVVGSIPKPEVANADWDLRKLGCSVETYLAATLQLRK
jgi:hypothetical protein